MHQIDAHLLPDGQWIAAVDGWFSEKILKSQTSLRTNGSVGHDRVQGFGGDSGSLP